MQARTTLILFLLAVGLVAYIIFVERHQETTDQRVDREQGGRILDIAWGDVRRLEIERRGDRTALERVREPNDWEVVEPARAQAARQIVDDVMNKFQFFREKSRLPRPAGGGPWDLAEFGLSPAEITVTIHHGARKAVLRLGKALAVGKKPDRYAMLDGYDQVFTVDPQLYKALDRPPADFIDRKIFALDHERLNRVVLEATGADGGEKRRIELKKDLIGWWIAGTPDLPVDGAEMERLLAGLKAMEASDWIPAPAFDPAKTGLAEPRMVVTLTTEKDEAGKEETAALSIGSQVPDADSWYAARSGSPGGVTLGARSVALVEPDRDRLRSKVYFDIPDHVLLRFDLRAPGVAVSIERQGNAWKALEPAGLEVDYGSVHTFLTLLRVYPVVTHLGPPPADLAKYGLAEPRIRFSLRMAYGNPPVESDYDFRIGWTDAEPDQVYGLSASGAELMRLAPEVKESFRRGALQFRRRDLLTVRRDRLFEFTVDHAAPTGARRLQTAVLGDAGKWRVRQEGREVEPSSEATLEAVLSHLTDVFAFTYEAENPPSLAPYGLDQPEVTVTFRWRPADDPNGPEQSETLRIGGEGPEDTRYCKLDSQPWVFTWEKSVVRFFQRDLLLPPEDEDHH